MDLFKVHIFELMKSHIYEPNISLISLFSLMLNYAKPRLIVKLILKFDDRPFETGGHLKLLQHLQENSL